MTRNLLVLVHPGSCCGSANDLIGRDLAQAARQDIARDLKNWEGDLLVLDGFLSDELPHYPMFAAAIDEAVARNRAAGHWAVREHGCDAEEPYTHQTVARLLAESKMVPDTMVKLTGASYDPADECGCINGVYDQLEAAGFRSLEVLDSCVAMPGDYDDEEEGDLEAVGPRP